jgi:hypothetical protein
VTLTATFEVEALLLYFDTDNRLQVGTWGTQVTSANIAFFKFASVVGFTFNNDSWGSGDIKFNPTSTANSTWEASSSGYQAIPNWDGYSGAKPSSYSTTTNADYITKTVHTLANVKLGYGDPCMLVGFTGAEVNQRVTLPTGSYRLPTNPENNAFVGYSGTAADGANLGGSYVTMSGSNPSIGTFSGGKTLPAVGARITGDSAYYWGTRGYYWSATPNSDANGYGLLFYSGYVGPSDAYGAQCGFPVRCVAK